jgi:transcriptional regulator with XRE-family HTH domain
MPPYLPTNREVVAVASNRIRELRRAAGLTQRDLRDRTGIHIPTLSQLENGHQRIWPGYARRIARALNVTIADLTEAKRHEELRDSR